MHARAFVMRRRVMTRAWLVLVACGVEHTRGYEREVAELQTQVHAVVSAELVLTVSC